MPTSDWAPTADDVGSQLRARTRDRTGVEAGTFTANTRPTIAEMGPLINQGVASVAMRVGSDLPAEVWDDAKRVAVLATALRVELSYYPEQVGTNRSPYAQLKQMFDDELKALIASVTAAGGTVQEAGAPLKPWSSFPMEGDPLIIGRGTRW